MTASRSVQQHLRALTKLAEEEMERECPRCGIPGGNPDCNKCDDGFGGDSDEIKESMGDGFGSAGIGSMDGGMNVHASVSLADQLLKSAQNLEYGARNFNNIRDDRPDYEKVASLLGFQAGLRKRASADTGNVEFDDHEEDDFDLEVNYTDDYTDEEQEEPHEGEEVYQDAFDGGGDHQLATNYDDDYTDEEMPEHPLGDKRASVAEFLQRRGWLPKTASRRPHIKQGSVTDFLYRRGMLKRANDPAMGGGAPPPQQPQGPPPGGAPDPMGGGAPQGMPMPQGPPPPPPGPDPMQVAMMLQSQGTLTPESLAQAAGISPQEAASIIAALAGGTGAQGGMGPPPAPPAGPMGTPADPGMGGPQGDGGMTVQASAGYDPASMFQAMLRKYAGEDVSQASIDGKKTDAHPADGDVNWRSMPGREFIQSNEAAMNFTAQQARRPRDQAVSSLFDNKVPYKVESGKGEGDGKMDEFIGDKTSAARMRGLLKAARSRRPLS